MNMKRRFLAIALSALCLISGFAVAYQVFSQFRGNIISQHEEKLTDIAHSVDRSAQGYIQIHKDILDYVTSRRGFLEAETVWEQTGDRSQLLLRLRENLLSQEMHIKSLLAVENGEVILSTDGNTGYLLPENLTELFLCQDNQGSFYFGILQEREPLSYAAVVELDVLCDYLAESSAVSERDQLLLIDRDAKAAIQHLAGQTSTSALTTDLTDHFPAIALTAKAVHTASQQVSFYETEKEGEVTTVGYALLGDKAADNGFFTVCVLDTYDVHLDALEWDTMRLVIAFAVILLGMVLMMSYIGSLFTENRKAARELKRLNERQKVLEGINQQTQQLAHHQRLETIGTLTSAISHEFNNLLTPIMSYSLMTLEKLPPEEEELSDNLIEIFNASEKAKEIISRLSDLSRKNSPNTFRSVSLDALVQKTLDIAIPAKPKQVAVKLNLNCWDQRIHANEIQITQMLLNLILNAFHAMEDTGILMIETTFDEHFVSLHVVDDGCGIPEEIQDRIFEPFFTTKDSGKGTGLGLAIVAQVVEDHRGTIRVKSKPGEGTGFEIRLPRLEETE